MAGRLPCVPSKMDTGVNVLKPHLQTTMATLLAAGRSQREIKQVIGMGRKALSDAP